MTTLMLAIAYLFWGAAVPAAFWALLLWLLPKTPVYQRRLGMGVTRDRS